MKEVVAYEAKDGQRFSTRKACSEYEEELSLAEKALADMPDAKPPYGRYVLHDAQRLRRVKRALWAIILGKYGKDYPKWQHLDADNVHPLSIVGRVLDDCGGPIACAWARLASYDFDTGRQYDQPYFVSHPTEAALATERE